MDGDENQEQSQEPKQNCHAHKPNKFLSHHEKKAKRALKRKLKLQHKQIKLETRLRHAIGRKDSRVEEETRRALRKMQEKKEDNEKEVEASLESPSCHQHHDALMEACNSISTAVETETLLPNHDVAVTRRVIVDLYQKLHSKVGTMDDGEKQDQHRDAVSLLKHMTKGTQSRGMFDNEKALWGYTRQKFFERAMLVNTSFGKLRHVTVDGDGEQSRLQRLAWSKLTSGSLKRICSIGCGPGNDAVGVVAFLQSLQKQQVEAQPEQGNCTLERVCMMDWAMVEWKRAVVSPLSDLLVPQFVGSVETSFCDATKSLRSCANREAWRALLPIEHSDEHTQDEQQHSTKEDATCNIDLFLFSYILAEQRGLWNEFLVDLVQIAKPGCMFYFSEHTPWQLHVVRKMFVNQLDFLWLDSSMYDTSLQVLDGRVGPGVLMGIKKSDHELSLK